VVIPHRILAVVALRGVRPNLHIGQGMCLQAAPTGVDQGAVDGTAIRAEEPGTSDVLLVGDAVVTCDRRQTAPRAALDRMDDSILDDRS
jgi:hypothetical protein